MNHKRKRSKRQVCCTMCTKFTWLGNHSSRFGQQYRKQLEATKPTKDERRGRVKDEQ